MVGFCRSSDSMGKLPRLMTYCNALSPETVIVIITTIVVVIVIIIVMNGIHCYIHTPTIHHTSRWFEVTLPAPTGYIVIKLDCMNAKLPHSGQAIDKGGRGKATDKESAISKGDAWCRSLLPCCHFTIHPLPYIAINCKPLPSSSATNISGKNCNKQSQDGTNCRIHQTAFFSPIYEDFSSS